MNNIHEKNCAGEMRGLCVSTGVPQGVTKTLPDELLKIDKIIACRIIETAIFIFILDVGWVHLALQATAGMLVSLLNLLALQ